jgi:hypothetical protein
VHNTVKRVDRANAAACKIARVIFNRLLPFSFGAMVAGTLQLGSPMRSNTTKQLADRSVPTIFLGSEPDGRRVLLLSNGNIAKTINCSLWLRLPLTAFQR